MTPLRPGTHFAQHRIVRLVATGAVAEVYEVIAPDGVRKALKILRGDRALLAKSQARFVQEAEAIAMIDHVHIVRFLDAGVEDGRVWMLLELVEGPDLRVLVRDAGGSLPVERVVSLVRQACEGVAAAHAREILHRDLKPENILVGPNDVAKVADFGSAKLAGWGVKTTKEQDLCSCLHASPEYIAQRRTEPRSDVYALGVILYETIAGVNPIAPSPMPAIEICRRQVTFEPAPLASVACRDVPGDLSGPRPARALSEAWPEDRDSARAGWRTRSRSCSTACRRRAAPPRAPCRGWASTRPSPGRSLRDARPTRAAGRSACPPPIPAGAARRAYERGASSQPRSLSSRRPRGAVFAATLRSPTVADPTRPPPPR